MSLNVKEVLMALGSWSLDLDYSHSAKEALFKPDGNPRKLWALVYDSDNHLVYPPLPLLWGKPGKEKIEIGGTSILWDLGLQGIGPTIEDREYLSGANKLDNPLFGLDPPDIYWRTVAENSGWSIRTNVAQLVALVHGNDVLEVDRKYPAAPGQAWEASATIFAEGRWRVRLLFEGQFNPPNLFPLIADGAWDEQVTNNPQAVDPAFYVEDGLLKGQTSYPIYQLVLNPDFADEVGGVAAYWYSDDPLWVADGSGAPDLPTSVHYEGSGFITADVVITDGSDVLTSATADWTTPTAAGMLLEGPGIPPYSYVLSVSAPGTLQMSALATEDHLAGDTAVAFRPQSSLHTYLYTAPVDGDLPTQYPVKSGDTWNLYCQLKRTANASGTATVNFWKIKSLVGGGGFEQAATFPTGSGGVLVLSTAPEPNLREVNKDTTIEADITDMGVVIELEGARDGRWWFSNVLLQRVGGNKDWIEAAAPVPVTDERTYEFRLPCFPGPALNPEAKTSLLVHLNGPGRPSLTIASSDQGPIKEGETATPVIVVEVTPPSGYTEATAEILVQDTYTDVFAYGEMTVVDKDRSTLVVDALAVNPWGSVEVSTVAPVGTESVRVQVVGEVFANGVMAFVSLVRSTADPATGNDIIADLLVHPTTGLPMGIAPGTIDCPEVIPFDWRQVNLTNLAALDHYCNVISEPTREFRINATLPATIDVSTSPFVVRDITLLPDDLNVEEVEDPTTDLTNRATEIVVVGAEVQLLSGQTLLITATAQVPGETEMDINNNPIVRTRPANDGTIDTFGYARAYAADQALRESSPGLVVPATLTGTDLAPVDVGDWLSVYKPESGIKDDANPQTVDGLPIFPRVMRIVGRERELGPSYHVVMLAPDGSTFDLTYHESDKDSTKLTLADRREFDWEADPGGGAAGNQYLRDRVSKPR